jgi:hypothetical protein
MPISSAEQPDDPANLGPCWTGSAPGVPIDQSTGGTLAGLMQRRRQQQ